MMHVVSQDIQDGKTLSIIIYQFVPIVCVGYTLFPFGMHKKKSDLWLFQVGLVDDHRFM